MPVGCGVPIRVPWFCRKAAAAAGLGAPCQPMPTPLGIFGNGPAPRRGRDGWAMLGACGAAGDGVDEGGAPAIPFRSACWCVTPCLSALRRFLVALSNASPVGKPAPALNDVATLLGPVME